jgi:hypothetical protein
MGTTIWDPHAEQEMSKLKKENNKMRRFIFNPYKALSVNKYNANLLKYCALLTTTEALM